MEKKSLFSKFAKKTAYIAGLPWTFLLALSIIVIWGITGPIFQYSDTWQLFINTGTTIITFLMVFLIQNSQNRDSMAVQLKLDELIRANKSAHNSLMDLEELEEQELEIIRKKFCEAAAKARTKLRTKQDFIKQFSVDEDYTEA